MKNIYLLPTQNNKSKLAIYHYEGSKNIKIGELGLQINNTIGWTNYWSPRELNITSDEEIKKGDWYFTLDSKRVGKSIGVLDGFSPIHKKIILTTDQDLIKDGVQAIDDEFLEWFVKNPSCEFIEIKHFGKCCCNPFISQCVDCKKYNPQYKIIIPKEESKQCDICKMYPRLEGTNKCESCYSVIRHFLEQDPELKDSLLPDLRKKQETLEEITEQIQKDCHKFVESIISKVTYQDATNTFLFMKLAELTLKLKKYE